MRGGPLGPWPHLVLEAGLKTMGHIHGTHPWPHLVLEAGPHLGQKPYYPPGALACMYTIPFKLLIQSEVESSREVILFSQSLKSESA